MKIKLPDASHYLFTIESLEFTHNFYVTVTKKKIDNKNDFQRFFLIMYIKMI